jgi:hypothetical protein
MIVTTTTTKKKKKKVVVVIMVMMKNLDILEIYTVKSELPQYMITEL